MQVFVNGEINAAAFDEQLRRGTKDLAAIVRSAVRTQSPRVDSGHILMALTDAKSKTLKRLLADLGSSLDSFASFLASSAQGDPNALPLDTLSESVCGPTAKAAFETALTEAQEMGWPSITEEALLFGALTHATQPVRSMFKMLHVELDECCTQVRNQMLKPVPVDVFDAGEQAPIRMDSFAPSGKKVLRVMQREAESMGYAAVDPRHLLLALLLYEGGSLNYGLHVQDKYPKTFRELVTLSLARRAKKTPNRLTLTRDLMDALLVNVLLKAGELAGRAPDARIAEPHIAQAFLDQSSMALHIIEGEHTDMDRLHATVEGFQIEEPEEDEADIASIEAVRERIGKRLVGQETAIEQILPYIELLKFGFRTPGRPVGVFLFCGPSGTGKTELAKELARAIYGSEDNLIFLEMGQFNSPESMNIFVGAPPGYKGYGEGKLTNGLAEKPQSVVLFDEVEKAHPKVLDALLRFLDEGRIDDPGGQVRDGSECIVILTSNEYVEIVERMAAEGKVDQSSVKRARKELRKGFQEQNFRVEFLNRVDELVLFRLLKKADYTEIASRVLNSYVKRLKDERDVELILADGMAEGIGAACERLDEGARAARRLAANVALLPGLRCMFESGAEPPCTVRVRLEVPADEADDPFGVAEMV